MRRVVASSERPHPDTPPRPPALPVCGLALSADSPCLRTHPVCGLALPADSPCLRTHPVCGLPSLRPVTARFSSQTTTSSCHHSQFCIFGVALSLALPPSHIPCALPRESMDTERDCSQSGLWVGTEGGGALRLATSAHSTLPTAILAAPHTIVHKAARGRRDTQTRTHLESSWGTCGSVVEKSIRESIGDATQHDGLMALYVRFLFFCILGARDTDSVCSTSSSTLEPRAQSVRLIAYSDFRSFAVFRLYGY